jgi:hypothetical protein
MPALGRTPIVYCCIVFLLTLPLSLKAQRPYSQEASGTSKQSTELTTAESKAVTFSDKLPANTVAVFDSNGELKTEQKVDPKKWNSLKDYASKSCSAPVPISPKCVRCKSGEILCAYVPKKR